MIEKKAKIVMITMFRNEAPVIKRMLESCKPFVDYYVLQNNGSTDGSDQIVKDFLVENGLSGTLYDVEEGWVGFGWNRDHLIQTCQQIDHGCDWILKMDCDEVLEVDPDFDWTILEDKSIQAFHVPAVSGTCIYYRAWMYNAQLPWRFNHDLCHETVYCDVPEIGDRFQCVDLPKSFRQVGYNEGQSWSNPTKFISDALKLEEKLISEQNMLENTYHFWYIGKSYTDCYYSNAFPLGRSQQEEFAKRSIFYFQEYVNHMHPGFKDTKQGQGEDEMSYMAMIFSAEAARFILDYERADELYRNAAQFAWGRNDHWFGLADMYNQLGDYEKMLEFTSIMMQPERVNPFPRYVMFIDTSMYHDGGSRVAQMHQLASSGVKKEEPEMLPPALPFYINTSAYKRLFVVDNFYSNPDEIRNYALTQVEYEEDIRYYKGLRSKTTYKPIGIKQAFEDIIGQPITVWDEHCYNGVFQIVRAQDPQVYHYDLQRWAAMIYLSPNIPAQSGTRTHRSLINGARHQFDAGVDDAFNGNFYDSTKWETIDSVGGVYNRLVIMDAQAVHSAGPYFGGDMYSGRLTHLFFFD